jgi:hypothetical protein
MIGIYSVDSMKLRIPLQNCTDISHKLQRVIHSVDDITGEILETSTKNWERLECEGIKTKFAIETEKIGMAYVKCLTILINSKMLKSDYFSGINKATIPLIYAFCMNQKLASFTYDSFLNAYCTDIDIKRDFVENEKVMWDAIKLMDKNALPHKKRGKGVAILNNGIEFNIRKNATQGNPFFKVYFKTNELNTESVEFTFNHLNEVPENLWRSEYTIKNSNHLKSLIPNMENNKLNTLMECSQDDFEGAYQKILKSCLGHRMRDINTMIPNDNIKPVDAIIVNLVIRAMDKGDTFDVAKLSALGCIDRKNKSKWNTKLNELFNAYIKPIENYSNYDKLEGALCKIGYSF